MTCTSCASLSKAVGGRPFRVGTPGASAQREYDRRRRREREAAIRRLPLDLVFVVVVAAGSYLAVQLAMALLNHAELSSTAHLSKLPISPSISHLIGMMLALVAAVGTSKLRWGRRQTTTAWSSGAKGEVAVGARVAQVSSRGVYAIHDRRIPGSRANIDHIAIAPTGIYVIDSKMTSGRPAARRTGPVWNRGPVHLIVGGRNRTSFVEGTQRQALAVAAVVRDIPAATNVPIVPMVVLVGAEWGWFANALRVGGVWIGWPKRMAKVVSRPGSLSSSVVNQLALAIATRLPEA